jgi:predicted TIM-barrel fold metal-dependent hydrolase
MEANVRMIIDSQVHVYDSSWPGARKTTGLLEVDGKDMVAAMERVGVDRAMIVSSWGGYRADTSFAESVFRHYPDRFRLIAPIDTAAPDVAARVNSWRRTPGAVGIRLLHVPEHVFEAQDDTVRSVMKIAGVVGLPVNVQCWGQLSLINDLARLYPDDQLIVDHVGLAQPLAPPSPAEVFNELPSVVALAAYPNVAIKITGACTYSRESFPYKDIWEPIGRVIDAFGVDRCMWGTDWTRTFRVVSYEEGVSAFRDHWPLSSSDLATLMGGTCMRIYGW